MREVVHEAYSFDGFTLDLTRGVLLRGDEEIRLRPKSYATLKYLVENNGRLVSKDELVEAVWADTAVTDNSLVQCLKEVRLALGDREQLIIKTVPRRGYIFNEKVEADDGNALYVEDVEEVRVLIHQRTDGETLETGTKTPVNAMPETNARSSRARVIAPAIVIIAVLGFFSYYFLFRSSSDGQHAATVASVKSLAILPFRSLNRDESDNYLGLGIADALITRLGRTNNLVIRPTSAVQKYTGSETDALAAGKEQRVDAVLEGSIQRRDNRLRVTVRMISTRDGSILWSSINDESFDDIFTLQDAVSVKLARALSINIGADERSQNSNRYTENVEAHQLYVKGVFLRNQFTQDSLWKSIECFQKAVELDPQYGLAYVGQASSLSPLAFLGHVPVGEAEVKNRWLIAKALELDSDLPEAHAALGEFKLFIEFDWDGAEQEFKRAIELNPNEHLAHHLYSAVLMITKRPNEALAERRRALEIDPLSPRSSALLALDYFALGEYDLAIEQYKKTLELYPNHSLVNLGPVYEKKGMRDEALKEYLEGERRAGTSQEELAALQSALAASGWQGYWKKRLELEQQRAKQRPVQAITLAFIYVQLDEKDLALDWLENAYKERNMGLILLGVDPRWSNLRTDPRFTSLLRRMHLEHSLNAT